MTQKISIFCQFSDPAEVSGTGVTGQDQKKFNTKMSKGNEKQDLNILSI